MSFIYGNLNFILVILVILAIITKINGLFWFLKLGAESPNPDARIQIINALKLRFVISIILASAFIFLIFEWGWLSIIAGAIFTTVLDFSMLGLCFLPTIIGNIIYKIFHRDSWV